MIFKNGLGLISMELSLQIRELREFRKDLTEFKQDLRNFQRYLSQFSHDSNQGDKKESWLSEMRKRNTRYLEKSQPIEISVKGNDLQLINRC